VPAGDKTSVNLILGPTTVQITTFMPEAMIIQQIEGRPAEGLDPVWAVFEGLNANDQSITIKLMRDKITGFVIAPLVRMAAVQPVQGRILQ
jgi:hypothetical protein